MKKYEDTFFVENLGLKKYYSKISRFLIYRFQNLLQKRQLTLVSNPRHLSNIF